MTKFLIVNGDDFGQTPGVTAGILEAHVNGILTSTSMLVTTPHAKAAAERSKDHPSLAVGLHFCLTNDKEQLTIDADDREACSSELRRQLDRFCQLMGTGPTHFDSHHNIHRDARLLPLFLELAETHGLPMREHSRVRYFSSFYGQWGGETHLEQVSVPMLEQMLAKEVGPGFTELSCHPGYVDEHLDSFYSIERETELSTLCHPAVRARLEALGITLISFRDVVSAAAGTAAAGIAS